MKKTRLTPFSKFLIVVVVVGGLAFAAFKFGLIDFDQMSDSSSGDSNSGGLFGNDEVVTVGVVTWGGYAGGQYFNKGFEANEESRFYQDYGFKVEFKVLDDFVPSRDAWKAGDVDLLWATIDAFTTEVDGLKDFNPRVIMQADWSRGGDAIVVRRGINSVADLKGKTVAFAEMTPSHTFLLWMLEAGGLKYSDIQPKIVESAINAADLFKKGQVDAAVVWSPDDADCVAKVEGAKILQNTREASNIIADIFIAKEEYLNENREMLEQLVEGWLKGAAEINQSDEAKKEAAQILSEGLGMDYDFCLQAINNVRLCTYGDNKNFFGLNTDYQGFTGEDIYNKMELRYSEIGYINGRIPSWSIIADPSLIEAINLSGPEHEAEGKVTFEEATEEVREAEAISTKQVSIMFPSGSYTLDENMKYIIDKEFLDIAKSFGNARIRIEGNTDNRGNRQTNIDLSRKRAEAVANYLIEAHEFDRNRFIIVGNGPDKPVATNDTEEGRAQNRRTDFELIRE